MANEKEQTWREIFRDAELNGLNWVSQSRLLNKLTALKFRGWLLGVNIGLDRQRRSNGSKNLNIIEKDGSRKPKSYTYSQ